MGNFTIQQTTDNHGQHRLVIAATNVSLTLGTTQVLQNGQGLFVVDSTSSSSVAGTVQGTITTDGLLPTGVRLSGTFGLSINESARRSRSR